MKHIILFENFSIVEKKVKIADNIVLTDNEEVQLDQKITISTKKISGANTIQFMYSNGEDTLCKLSFTDSKTTNFPIEVITSTVGKKEDRKAVGFKKFPEAFSLYLLPSAKGKGVKEIDQEIGELTLKSIFSITNRFLKSEDLPKSFKDTLSYLKNNLKTNKEFNIIAHESPEGEKLNHHLYVYIKNQV